MSRPDRAAEAHQGLPERQPLSSASESKNKRGIPSMSSDGIESAFDPHDEVPLSWVAFPCGHMQPIHATTCGECGEPRPRELVDALPSPWPDSRVVCLTCGDEDGPWAIRRGFYLCERCLGDEEAAS